MYFMLNIYVYDFILCLDYIIFFFLQFMGEKFNREGYP